MTLNSILAATLTAGAVLTSARAATLYGVGTDNHLYRFNTAAPGVFTDVGALDVPGIVDIDFHAANGRLYGITSNGTAYTIDVGTAATTLRVTPTSPLSGVQDFDFNPMADRMRVSTAGGGNFRLVPDFITPPSPAGAVGTVVNDGFYSGAPGGVTVMSTAYTNAFDSPPTTVLYSIGSDGRLYSHSTGAGALGSFGVMSGIGSGLGFNLTGNVGFDIVGSTNAFVSVGPNLYSLDLTTGAFTDLPGTTGLLDLASIAVVPEPSSALLGLLGGVALLRRRRR